MDTYISLVQSVVCFLGIIMFVFSQKSDFVVFFFLISLDHRNQEMCTSYFLLGCDVIYPQNLSYQFLRCSKYYFEFFIPQNYLFKVIYCILIGGIQIPLTCLGRVSVYVYMCVHARVCVCACARSGVLCTCAFLISNKWFFRVQRLLSVPCFMSCTK